MMRTVATVLGFSTQRLDDNKSGAIVIASKGRQTFNITVIGASNVVYVPRRLSTFELSWWIADQI